MRASAELHREARHAHDAHDVAVFLGEERHRASLLGLVKAHVRDLDVLALEDDLVDECLDVSELLRRDRLEVREVEAQAVRRDRRAGLVDLVADDLLEGSL